MTSGTQNALLIILLSLFKADDKIATDTFTYTNFITLAHQMQLELIPILSDNQGIIPRDLEKKIRQQGIKGLYLVPTVNNPTATSIPLQRRKAISSIIKQYSLLLIEDDAYAFTNSRRLPPFVSLIPEQTLYIHSLSKSLSPYLRTAYLVAPQGLIAELNTTSQTINAPISALHLQFTDYLLTSGKSQAVIRQKKKLIVERNTLYQHFSRISLLTTRCLCYSGCPFHQDGMDTPLKNWLKTIT